MNRRQLLGLGAGTACMTASASALPAWLARAACAAPEDERRLVVIELRGGNDGLNTVVPFEDAHYFNARPNVALEGRKLQPLDELNRFNPKLRRTSEWFREGRVAIWQSVGYAPANLSHFESQDIWHSAEINSAKRRIGWLGGWKDDALGTDRGAEADLTMLAVGPDALPYALTSRGPRVPAVESLESFGFRVGRKRDNAQTLASRRRAMEALRALEPAEEEARFLQDSLQRTARASELLRSAEGAANRADYPGTTLGRSLRDVARVIDSGLPTRVYYLVHDGFDTHTEQRRDQDKLLGAFDAALHAFLSDLKAQDKLDTTLVMTTSEFGRRVAENGEGRDAGTDHGTASCQLFFGGGVRAGLHGGQPDLAQLDTHGNQQSRIDFRNVYATVIGDWLRGDATAILGGQYESLPLLEVTR